MRELVNKLLNNRITKTMLKNRGIESLEDVEKFAYPCENKLSDPFCYTGVKEAVERINKAINDNERVLICGDYDTDGVSATFVMLDFLRSRGVRCDFHIPSRMNEGYGLRTDIILAMKEKPSLIITVDCGISCADEIDILMQNNIDVIVTDHHNVSDRVPNCIIFDPKQDEGLFSGFCGAGVALKLVQAIAGRDAINKYLDIVAIATVGDIVPLECENRTLVSLGLRKIKSNPEHNIKMLLDYLYVDLANNIVSTDISYRVVPFLNSAGRISDASKVVQMLTATNDSEMQTLLEQIAQNNRDRIKYRDIGLIECGKLVGEMDLNRLPIVIISSPKFEEGIVGILASDVANQLKRPAIILSDKGDYLKGSGRSFGDFNLHNVVMERADLCEKVGGHDYACGLTISKANFEQFKAQMIDKLNGVVFDSDVKKYEMEIDVEDVTPALFELLNVFEPYGLKNPKPTFMLKAQKMSYDYLSLKSHLHYQLNVDGLKVIAFDARKYLQAFDSNEIKELYVELNQNLYNNRTFNQVRLKSINTKDVFKVKDDIDQVLADEIYTCYECLGVDEYDAVEIDYNGLCEIVQDAQQYGTVFVVRSQHELEIVKTICKALNKELPIRFLPMDDTTSMICVKYEINKSYYNNYSKIVYMSKPHVDINLKARDGQEIYTFVDEDSMIDLNKYFSLERKDFGFIFSILSKFVLENKQFDDIWDIVNTIEKMQNVFKKSQIMLNLCVFWENSLIELQKLENKKIVLKAGSVGRNELNNSRLYNIVKDVL